VIAYLHQITIMKLRNIIPISSVVPGAHFVWQTTVKGGRALGAALAKVLHFRGGGMTSRWYNAIMSFAKYVVKLQRRNGWTYVVIYLKACAVLLQQAAGGLKIENTRDLKCAVSRSRSGIPRIIPPVMRRAIQSKDIWTIRIWLSMFRLYQVIDMRTVVKLESIMTPSSMDIGTFLDWANFLNAFVPCFLKEVGYVKVANLWPWSPGRNIRKDAAVTPIVGLLSDLPANGKMFAEDVLAWLLPKGWEGLHWNLKPKLLAILKSSPNTGGVHKPFLVNSKEASPTSIGAVFSDFIAWRNPGGDPELRTLSAGLWPLLQEWLTLTEDRAITRLLELSRKVYDSLLSKPPGTLFEFPGFGRLQGLGKLSFKPEPAGKTRTFAMVDGITQMIMKPVHDGLFRLLRVIEQDGTFDQMAPAKCLVARGLRNFWSFDLSSATDRFPLLLQHSVLGLILGHRLAGLWMRLLTDRPFIVPSKTDRKIRPFKVPRGGLAWYLAGQPMGALTSWAAFSLTHHIVVQWAAYKAFGVIHWFTDYALLGDDIVIANAKVAEEYLLILRAIGVEVGLAKSMISRNGSFEFAKRTFICGQDASHLSLLAIGVAKADHSVLEQLLTRLDRHLSVGEALRIGAKVLGYGYRTVARLPAVLQTRSRLQGMAILLTRPGTPWGLPARDWFLQRSPGEVREVTEVVETRVASHLWVKLRDSLLASVNAHLRGMAKVRLADEYGTGATVMDPGNWHRNTWEYYVLGTILADMRVDLRTIQDRAMSMTQPTVREINALFAEIDELREALDAIPVVPNIVERARLEFGGKKRSASIRLWRSIQRNLAKELACNLSSDV
jgi:hypothetical protein